jgi:steroid delta-isomerase-like uncharacterized protein
MAETTPAENKAIVQQLYAVINQRNVDSLPDFFAAADGGTCQGVTLEQMVSNPLLPGARLVPPTTARLREREGGPAQPPQLEALLDFTRHMFSAFPDMLVNIDSMVAEGDTVVVHWSARGTHIGEFLGTPPTGRTVPFRSIDFFTFRNGKIASHTGYPDTARVLARLGQLPLTPIARVLSGPDDA